MTVKITKPSINVREKLSELDKETGIKGEELLRADTAAEAREALQLDEQLFTDFESTGIDDNATSTAMTLDSSGNLLVGTTNPDVSFGTTTGSSLQSSGQTHHSSSGTSLILNRTASDGTIAQFRKGGTTVGSIGTAFTNNLFVGSSNIGLSFISGNSSIYPMNPSNLTIRDAGVNLGNTGARFNNLYLSAGAYASFIAGQNDTNTSINFTGSDVITFNNGGSEAARIDASGNLLVGQSVASLSTVGHLFLSDAQGDYAAHISNGSRALLLNRLTNFGDIISLRANSTEVGTIGSANSSEMFIEGNDRSGLWFATNAIRPYKNNTGVNGITDIGSSSYKFKDAHFSGTVNANAFVGDGSGLTGVGGGAWTKLNTYNLSSGTNSFSAPSLLDTTAYSRFVIIIDDVILTSPYSRDLYIKLTGDNGSSYTNSTKWTSIFERAGNATASALTTTKLTIADSPAVISKGLFNIEITKPINSRVKGETNGGYEGASYGHCTVRGSSYWNLSTLTGFQITVDSPATFSSGTITVYGVE